ncbi:hypothetical protein KIPB_007525 [Kipferlia bialata]|uniref:Kelch repeat type 1 n=1 Tax=Kipferlia bialata TaxID=797122 RepID=A0A9K3CYP0_9EUKA|nr:hypothetical protein KIPB_007525 [Kipferlia bialata]|eukprot:g7525.t1
MDHEPEVSISQLLSLPVPDAAHPTVERERGVRRGPEVDHEGNPVRHGDPQVSWEWRQMAPMPREMMGYAINRKGAVVGGSVYFPLRSHPHVLDSPIGVARLDLRTEEWTVVEGAVADTHCQDQVEAQRTPRSRARCLVASFGHSLVLAGGITWPPGAGRGVPLRDTWVYDTQYHTWEALSDVPTDDSGGTLSLTSETPYTWVGDTLHVFGSASSFHLSLSPDGFWTTYPSPLYGQTFVALPIGEWVYMVTSDFFAGHFVTKQNLRLGTTRDVPCAPFFGRPTHDFIIGCQTGPTSAIVLSRQKTRHG